MLIKRGYDVTGTWYICTKKIMQKTFLPYIYIKKWDINMWKCKWCNEEFDYTRTTDKANHSRWCKENPNRLNGSKKLKETNKNKMFKKWKKEHPTCRICKKEISFKRWRYINKNFCGSAECWSIINKQNGSNQDKTKISEQVRNSKKWVISQKAVLDKRRSEIEKSIIKALKVIYKNINTNMPIVFDNSTKFVDIVINNIYIEIDGYYHLIDENIKSNDKQFDQWCKNNQKKLIRYNIANIKHPEREYKFVKLMLAIDEIKKGQITII